MKPVLTIAFMLGVLCSEAFAQIHSVNVFGSYSIALGKRLSVTRADALGGGVELRVRVSDNINISVIGGFERYSIDQDSALAKWNWRFWVERYSGIVKDNLASDSSLSATLNPVQYMEVVPILAAVSIELSPAENLTVRPSIGGGVLFYTRSLYLQEEWQKRFHALDYTFEYSYRNFAGDKKGNPFVVFGRAELSYQLSDLFTVDASARYTTALNTDGKYGYDEFPFRDMVTFTVGLSFLY